MPPGFEGMVISLSTLSPLLSLQFDALTFNSPSLNPAGALTTIVVVP